jgi:hypothetical protein
MTSDKFDKLSDKDLSPKERILLKFMTATIGRINTCLINIHALQSLLIKKGILTQKELQVEVRDATKLPTVSVGKKVLMDMVRDFDVSKLVSMIDLGQDEKSTLKSG